MRNACRPAGRFFCLLKLMAAVVLAVAMQAQTNGPSMTQVTDNVYRADGTAAKGTVLLSWPAFTTADGKAVAAGSLNVQLGSGGAFTASLAPNTGGQPAGVYYKVVYQLAGQEPSTEYWVVPATGSTTIGAVRAKLMPATAAAQVLTRDVADTNYVQVNGDQTMNGTVTFKSSPAVPAPQNPGDAANKGYVDSVAGGASVNLASPAPIGTTTPNTAVFTITNGVYNPTAYSGSDIGAKINTVASSLGCPVVPEAVSASYSAGTIQIPPGTYNYSTDIYLPCPMRLICAPGTTLNYTGTGNAVKFGIDGLADASSHKGRYELAGCTFTGGASATHGLFVNTNVVDVYTHNNAWISFGSGGVYDVYLNGNNWLYHAEADRHWHSANGIYTAGTEGGRMVIEKTQVQNCTGTGGGVGVYMQGPSSITHSTVSACAPNIVLNPKSGSTFVVDDVYMEVQSGDTHGCIGYGGEAGDNTSFIGSSIVNNECNLHSETGATGSFLFPRAGGGKFQLNVVNGNRVFNLPAGKYLVKETDAPGTGNQASGNTADFVGFPTGQLHSNSSATWYGTDGELASSTAPSLSVPNIFTSANTFNTTTYHLGNVHIDNGFNLFGHSDAGITQKFKLDAQFGIADFVGGYKVNGTAVVDATRNATVNNLTVNGTCTGCGGGTGSLSSPGPIGNTAPNTGAFTTLAAQVDGQRYKVEGFPSSCTVNLVAYSTQFDCAFQTAYYAAQTQSANQTLELGNAIYLTNVGLQQSSLYGVNIIGVSSDDTTGGLNGGSVIRLNSSISPAVMTFSVLPASGPHRAYMMFRDFTIDANNNAPMCLDASSMRETAFKNISCEHATGPLAWVKFGTYTEPTDASGSNFDMDIGPIHVIGPFGNPAKITANVAGGNISTTGYTVTNGGSLYYNGPTVTAYLIGYGAGANPCTTMPTGLHATVSGGSVISVSSATPASGCSGNVYVYAPDLPPAAYGFYNAFTTDSTFTDIIVEGVGNVAAIYDFGNAANVWIHPHSWEYQPVGLESHGGGTFMQMQCDVTIHYCVDFEPGLSHPELGGTYSTKMIGTLLVPGTDTPGSSLYYFGSNELLEIALRDDYVPGPIAADFHRFVSYAIGPVNESVANFQNYLPAGFQATGFQSYNAPAVDKFDYHGYFDEYIFGSIKSPTIFKAPIYQNSVTNILNGQYFQGYSDNQITRTFNIDASTGSFFSPQFYATNLSATGLGQASLSAGDAAHSGFIKWYSPSGTTLGFMGYDSANKIGLWMQGGNAFDLEGGPFQIGGNTVIDASSNATVNNLTVNGTCTGCGASSSGYGYMVSKYASIQAAINAAYGTGVVSGKVIDDRTAAYSGPGFYIPDSVTVELAPVPYTFTGTVTHNNGNNNVTAAIVVEQGAHLKGSSTSSNHGTTIGVSAGFAGDIVATTSEGTGIGTAAQWWHWGSIENLNISGANQTSGRCLVVENMGETSRVENILARACYGNNIEIIGASATQSSIRNITTGRSQTASGIRFTNLAGVGKVDGLSGDCNPTALVSVQENAAGSLTILGLKAEGEASICTGTVHDPVILLDGMSGFNDHVRVIGGYAFGTAQSSFAKFVNAGNAILETDGLYITGYTNMLNDTVRSVTVPLASSTSKQPFYYEPGGTTFANQAFTFAPGTFIQGGGSALTEIFGSSTDGSSMIAAQGNGDGTSYYTGGLKIGIPNRTQFGQPPEMMARMGSRFLGAGNGYDTNTWVFVPIWKSGDTSNRWIGEPNQRWPEVYAADVNATTATVGTLNVTSCTGCGVQHSISIQGPTAATSGTGSMTALYSVTIPAGTLSVGTGLRCVARSRHTTGTASVSMAWKLGNTTYTYPTPYSSGSGGGDASIEIFTFSSLTAETVNIPWASFGGTTQTPFTGLAWSENVSGPTTLQFLFNVAATDKLTGDGFYCGTIQ